MRSTLFLASPLFWIAWVPACSSEESGGKASTNAQPVAWAAGQAEAANGTAADVTVVAACGSDTETYLKELLTTSPQNAKVQQEWGDCVPGGKQVMVSGSVATTHLGPQDEPMSHQYGDDLSMNIELDSQFMPFRKHLGTEPGEETDTQMHVEISSGLIPHLPFATPGPDTGQTWQEMSQANYDLSGFQPGFAEPNIGDRILIMGRWIIDCGHANFSSELHAMSFLAWAHAEGSKTVVRTYYNPYRDSEHYNPDFTMLGNVDDATRFGDANTKTFPAYLVDEVVRVVAGQSDHLRSYELMDSTKTSPAEWQVCAPVGSSGSSLSVHYDVVTRQGVTFTVTKNDTTGCAAIHTSLDAGYTPAKAALRHCVLPWDYLNQIAGAAVGSTGDGGPDGGGGLDIRQKIETILGKPSPGIDADPEAACADALNGPPVSASPAGQNIRKDDSQPIPFYGVITVEWNP